MTALHEWIDALNTTSETPGMTLPHFIARHMFSAHSYVQRNNWSQRSVFVFLQMQWHGQTVSDSATTLT